MIVICGIILIEAPTHWRFRGGHARKVIVANKRNLPSDWGEITAEFGRRIRDLRRARGMTQEQLAQASGVSRNQIQNVEVARSNARDEDGNPIPSTSNPTLDTIWSIARALDVEVTFLVARDAGSESESETSDLASQESRSG